MSLAEAVIHIAEEMEKEADPTGELPMRGIAIVLQMYAKALRIAVKAAEGSAPMVQQFPTIMDAHRQHILGIEEARREFRAERESRNRVVDAAEDADGMMVDAIGGPADGTSVAVPGKMPIGAKTMIAGAVYALEPERKLRCVEPPRISS